MIEISRPLNNNNNLKIKKGLKITKHKKILNQKYELFVFCIKTNNTKIRHVKYVRLLKFIKY